MDVKTRFLKQLREDGEQFQIYRYLAYAASPVIAGVKTAELITIEMNMRCPPEWWAGQRRDILDSFGLSCREFRVVDGALTLLIYDAGRLDAEIRGADSRSILSKYGYDADGELDMIFEHLQRRFDREKFPHEIGLFLGFPPRDVQSFIENKGKNFHCCKYWKVYHDVDRAERVFASIDRVKRRAVGLLLNRNRPVQSAVEKLRYGL